MADLHEVEEGFLSIIAETVFSSSYVPYSIMVSSLTGTPVRVFRGWPLDNQLKVDLQSTPPVTNISIFSAPELSRDTTCHLRRMTEVVTEIDTPSMTAVVSGNTVTFDGTGSANECIGVAYLHAGYSHRLSQNDTANGLAALFAANIPGAMSSGATLTLNTTEKVTATYGADFTTLTELHRQEQVVRISVWAPTVELRDQLCSALDPAIMWHDRMLFAENSISGPIRNAGTHVDDVVGLEFMWRRDLLYKIDYATTYKQIEPPFVLGELTPIGEFV